MESGDCAQHFTISFHVILCFHYKEQNSVSNLLCGQLQDQLLDVHLWCHFTLLCSINNTFRQTISDALYATNQDLLIICRVAGSS